MSPVIHPGPARRPSIALSVAIFVVVVGLMAWLRLEVYPDKVFPVAFFLPLLICLWHRDKVLLWAMVVALTPIAVFSTQSTIPTANRPDWPPGVFIGLNVMNILIPALIIHALITARNRIMDHNAALGRLNANLEASNDELAARDEEISRQNEELKAQTEELEHQSAALRKHAEELRAVNAELAAREGTLQTLLELTSPHTSEEAALKRICELTPRLLGGPVIAAVLLESDGDALVIHAHSGFADRGLEQTRLPVDRSFAALVMRQGQTGYLRDMALRPDLVVPQKLGGDKFGSILAVPLRLRGQIVGTLEAFCAHPHDWTSEEARLLEWLGAQVSDVWETIRLRQEHERAEAAVRVTAETLGFHLENAPLAIVEWDPHFVVTRWTGQAQQIFGWSSAEVSGRRIDQMNLVVEEDWAKVQGAMDGLLHGPGGINVNANRNYRKDGTVIHCEWYSSALHDPQGDLMSVLSYVLDVTTRTQAQESLRLLTETLERQVAERTAMAEQRSAELRALAIELTQTERRERRRLAQLLHDGLQQLLVAAKMHLSMVPESSDRGEVRQSIQQVDDLLGQAVEAARSLTVEFSPPILFEQRLVVAFRWLARQMQEKHGLSVEVREAAGREPPSEDIRVVLFNAVRELLFNTVKHAGVREARVTLGGEGSDRIEVVVEDHGRGFDPVAVRNNPPQGGGFGLFSVRERLALLGGAMHIDSAPGRGCRIRLTAPLRLDASRPPIAHAGPAAAKPVPMETEPELSEISLRHGRRIRVMLVDDHRLLRDGLAELLRTQSDIQVVGEAADGVTAVELARELRPDVIIMDVGMPRMNGIEATRLISSENSASRIIGLSMHEETDLAEAMREAGATDFLTKGGPSETLVAAIRSCVAPPAAESA